MPICGHLAYLVITRNVEGTSTSVARARIELHCDKPDGHEGNHASSEHNEEWRGKPGERTTILRHEDELP
jgi:hypothetical protein